MNKIEIKILLADDHQVVRNGLMLMLNQQKAFIPKISEAQDGNEVIAMVEKEPFDIIIMDISLPNRDGIDSTEYLTQKYPDIRVLALSMHNEDYIIRKMLNAGAMGYLFKNTGMEELTNAIISLMEGNRFFSNEVSQTLITSDSLHVNKFGTAQFHPVQLTKREKEILFLIASEFTNTKISNQLEISVRTVENHRQRILKKLNIKTSAGLVKYALQNGIVK